MRRFKWIIGAALFAVYLVFHQHGMSWAMPVMLLGATNQNLQTGIFTDDVTSSQVVRSVAKKVYDINEGEDELLQRMLGLSKASVKKGGPSKVVPVTSRKFEYNEKRLPNRYVTITGVAGDVLTVSAADWIICGRPGAVLRADLFTKVGRVYSAAASPNVTLVAGQGALFAIGDICIVAGNAGGEGANFASPSYFDATLQYNYLQEVSFSYQVTRWLQCEARYDAEEGDMKAMQEKDALLRIKIAVNQAQWFGHLESGTDSGANRVFGTKGVLETIVSNYTTFAGGVLTFGQLRQMIGDFTLKSPSAEIDEYIAPDVWALLDDLWFGKQQISAPIIEEAGVKMRKVHLGPKTLNLIQCVHFQSGTKFGNLMVGIDPKYYEIKTGKNIRTGRAQWMMEFAQGEIELGNQTQKVTQVCDVGANLIAEEAHHILDGATSVA